MDAHDFHTLAAELIAGTTVDAAKCRTAMASRQWISLMNRGVRGLN